MRALVATIGVSVVLAAPAAAAHEPGGDALPSWHVEPLIALPLLATLLLFALGYWQLRRRSARGEFGRRGGLFLLGWLLLTLALVSPLHEAGERSFAAHMFEHELIMLAAAPCLVLARPAVILLWGFPDPARGPVGALARRGWFKAIWHRLTEPVTATTLQAVVLWAWHSPSLFDMALENEAWHAVQHASFLVSALLFWTAVLNSRQGPQGYPLAALCLFATSIVSGALGALMAFSQSPWYAPYAALGLAPFGLTPAEDQQIAGLIMWVPGGLVHALAALAMIGAMLRVSRREVGDAG
ncbi:cytochrome c oxidase assembly protein [Sphingomonas sp. 3P27F8]|uniref:cytochrome c oxidase assembly protein n=1 Tax=Sphingomonas sp. 3P27F8 TaxID=2502213 RepID=UPI0010F87286|nr:cytochrome c oxidase assembly protein [Sphingomonas sp. 3P27F8]